MRLWALLFMTFIAFQSMATERIYLVDTGIKGLSYKKCGLEKSYDRIVIEKHGTQMAKEMLDYIKDLDYCIQSYDVYSERFRTMPIQSIVNALSLIKKQPVGIINLSMDGRAISYIEKNLLFELARKGFTINIASGNSKSNLTFACIAYPACYFRVKMHNVNVISNNAKYANKSGPVTHVVAEPKYSSGTSGSTAMFTGKLVRKRLTGFRFYKHRPRRNYVEKIQYFRK